MKRVSTAAGFTLVEVLVALLILGFGLLGLAMLQTTALRFNTNSYSRTQATLLAYEIVERMRGNPDAFLAGNYNVTSLSAANTIVASAAYTCNRTSTCTCESSSCSNATLATFDLGQWYYRLDQLLPGAQDAASSGLGGNAARATISSNGNTATITLYWLEQDSGGTGGTTASPKPVSQVWEVQIFRPT